MTFVMPPESREKLDQTLNGPDAEVYLVIGPNNAEAWESAQLTLADYLGAECVYAERRADVLDLIENEGDLGWPEGTPWAPQAEEPTAICFGWGSEPIFYLTRAQAEDMDIIDAAFSRAEALTQQ